MFSTCIARLAPFSTVHKGEKWDRVFRFKTRNGAVLRRRRVADAFFDDREYTFVLPSVLGAAKKLHTFRPS